GERVAYRVLYHAEQPPDGEAIGPILEAVARNTGPVTLVWCLHRGAAPDASAHSDPSRARTPGSWPEPGPAREPRLDEPGTPSAGRPAHTAHSACSPVDISLYIVASASARSTL